MRSVGAVVGVLLGCTGLCLGAVIQFDLSAAMDKDLVYETGGGADQFGENPLGDQAFVEDGYDDGDTVADGLPTDRILASAVGLGNYLLRPYNGNNAIELDSASTAPNEEHVIDVPNYQYTRLGLLVSAVDGDVSFTIKLNYLDGTATTNWWEADDWVDAETGFLRASQNIVIRDMDRVDVSTGNINDDDAYALYEFIVSGDLDSTRVLDSITIGNTPNRWNSDNDDGWGGLFAMNGETAIPEPAAVALLALGLGAASSARRRRLRRALA